MLPNTGHNGMAIQNIKELPWHIAPTQSLSQPNFDQLTLGDFERVANLGRGGYARVYLVRLKKEPNKTYWS